MDGRFQNKSIPPAQATYEIKVKGVLDAHWSERLGGLIIASKDGDTTISGSIVDQAALHGLLMQIRDLGLPLLSVERLEPEFEHKEKIE